MKNVAQRTIGEVPQPEPSLAELLSQLRDEAVELVRNELQLAKLELTESVQTAGRSFLAMNAGLVVSFMGANLLTVAAAIALTGVFFAMGAGLIVAAFIGFLVSGAILVMIGLSVFKKQKEQLSEQPKVAENTIQTLKENKQWIQEKTTNN